MKSSRLVHRVSCNIATTYRGASQHNFALARLSRSWTRHCCQLPRRTKSVRSFHYACLGKHYTYRWVVALILRRSSFEADSMLSRPAGASSHRPAQKVTALRPTILLPPAWLSISTRNSQEVSEMHWRVDRRKGRIPRRCWRTTM